MEKNIGEHILITGPHVTHLFGHIVVSKYQAGGRSAVTDNHKRNQFCFYDSKPMLFRLYSLLRGQLDFFFLQQFSSPVSLLILLRPLNINEDPYYMVFQRNFFSYQSIFDTVRLLKNFQSSSVGMDHLLDL